MNKRDIQHIVLVAHPDDRERDRIRETLFHWAVGCHGVVLAGSVEECRQAARSQVALAVISENLSSSSRELAQGLLQSDPRLHVILLVSSFDAYRSEFGDVSRLWFVESGSPIGLVQMAAAILARPDFDERTSEVDFLAREVVEGEQRFRTLFQESRDAIFIHDFEGRFLDANAAALALVGYPRSELHAVQLANMVDPVDLSKAVPARDLLVREISVGPVEYVLLRGDGGRAQVEASSVLVRYRDEPCAVLAIARDITARKEGARMLLLLQAAIATTGAGVSIKNMRNDIVYANPAEARMHGYGAQELIGKPASILGLPDAKRASSFQEEAQAQTLTHETINVRRDGSRFPVRLTSDVVKNEGGEAIGVVTVCEDITEREQARQLLAASEARLRSLVERLPDAIAITVDYRVIFANQVMASSLGFAVPADVLGLHVVDMFGQQNADAIIAAEEIQGRKDLSGFCWTSRDGRAQVAQVSVLAVDIAGQPAQMLIVRDMGELTLLRQTLGTERFFHGLLGESAPMRALEELVRQAAPTDAPVLLTGETGTGKEVLARAIHAESRRRAGPFIAVNCGALPEGLVESELFGHTRGAFTGAVRDHKGRFELAAGGSLFLDEVGELSPTSQVRLLRVLEEKRINRVGSESSIPADVRIISATNRNLQEEVRRGRFRRDLFFRLCVIPIELPPLRARGADVILLAEHFIAMGATQSNRSAPRLSSAAKDALLQRRWSGNVRELQNAMQFALVKAPGAFIDVAHLPAEFHCRNTSQQQGRGGRKPKLEQKAVEQALHEADGNKARAAKILGVARGTLYRHLADLQGGSLASSLGAGRAR